jgi:phosphoglycolate phosphatase
MQTGLGAKVKTVGVTWGFRTREELEAYKPFALIDKPEELIPIIS